MTTRKIKRIEKAAAKQGASAAAQGRRVWLAGLGAFSLAQKRGKQSYANAQKQGREMYVRLIAESKDLRTRTLTLVREAGADAQAQAIGVFSPLTTTVEKKAEQYSAAVEGGFAKILHRLGVPTKRELDELSKRIASVSRQVKTAK
jgi:poly(hydroxyalkanoate) granule-associated protein